jgi:hypothetical protein
VSNTRFGTSETAAAAGINTMSAGIQNTKEFMQAHEPE